MAAALTPEVVDGILARVPDEWLARTEPRSSGGGRTGAYTRYLLERLAPPRPFIEEAIACPLRYTYYFFYNISLSARALGMRYRRYLLERLAGPRGFVEEAARAR